ncbi:MAG: hypothetical protein QXM12_05190 [Nitrososphaerota archaeon]
MLRVMVWEHDVRERLESNLHFVGQIPPEHLYQPELSIIDPYKFLRFGWDTDRPTKNYNYKKQFIRTNTVVKEGYITRGPPLFNIPGTRGWFWRESVSQNKYANYPRFLPLGGPDYQGDDHNTVSWSASVDNNFVKQSAYGTVYIDDYQIAFNTRDTIEADFVKLFDLAKSFLQEQFNAVKRTACDGAEVMHISNTGRVVRGWQIGHGLYHIPTLQAGWVVVKKPGFETVSVPARFNEMVTITLHPRIYVRLNALVEAVYYTYPTSRYLSYGTYDGHALHLNHSVYLSVGLVWGSRGSDLKIPFYKHPVLLSIANWIIMAGGHVTLLSHFFPLSLSSEKTITHSCNAELSNEFPSWLGSLETRLNLQVNARIKAVEISSYPRDFPPPHYIEYL